MNKKYRQFIFCFFSIIFMLFISAGLSAQCNNVTLKLTPVTSQCASDGKIIVTLTGSDVPNIDPDNMEFQVSGTQNHSFANYVNNTIENLPAGTYTIKMRAFCNVTNEWFVATSEATTTITTTYRSMEAIHIASDVIKTLNCKPTGIVPIIINASTGSSPFTVTIKSKPDSYTGPLTFTFNRTSTKLSFKMDIEGLNDGDYTFEVTDACSYSQTINSTVGKMEQDFRTDMFESQFYPSAKFTPGDCNLIGLQKHRSAYSSWDKDNYYYFYQYAKLYFDLGVQLNGTGTIEWLASDTLDRYVIDYRLPYSMGTFRTNDDKLTTYIRVKGTSCIHKIRDISIDKSPYPSTNYSDLKCDSYTLKHTPYTDYDGVYCYPYKWRIISSDGLTVIKPWSDWIYTKDTQIAENLPYGYYKFEFEDHEGFVWQSSTGFMSATPSATYISVYTNPSANIGMTGNVFHSYFRIYFNKVDYLPVGTRIRYVPGSGPATPIHTDITIASGENVISFYPFSDNYKSSKYTYIPAGVYQFEVTLPGVGCTTQLLNVYHSNSIIETPFTYTTKETCGGLSVIPKSGQLATINSSGQTTTLNTYYSIYSVTPSSVPIDRTPVSIGDTLFLPASGKYTFGMNDRNKPYYVLAYETTLDYTKTVFSLNPNVTSAYVCQGESTAFIRVKGMGGSDNYSYELYDEGVMVRTSTDGTFNYGEAGKKYTVKLIDNDPNCAASYEQDVVLLDLGITQIAYSSSPDNNFCYEDSIYLKCITLGETSYLWTGPGITSLNESEQNPAIAASDIGVGTHTFTITVKPEGCGKTMVQTLVIRVEDCSGAQDDYVTLFVNTPDSIDVLANDKFPSNCGPSVTPAVTTGPTNGSYSIVNKKIVYTPNTDFTGKDSLTYRTICGSDITYAKVYITVIERPDNIVDPDCWIEPEKKEWKIQLNQQLETVATTAAFVVGDMNEDGFPDIVAYGISNRSSIKIFWGPEFTSVKEITGVGADSNTTLAIAKVKVSDTPSDQYESFIFYRSGNTLRALRTDGTSPWSINPNSRYPGMIGVADFNGDGWSEVFLGNQIYDAATGKLLCDGGTAENSGTTLVVLSNAAQPVAIDILGDSDLELVAGNKIYKVNIDRNTSTPKSLTLLSSVSPPTGCPDDGLTVVADFDNDGKLEVLVRRRNNNTGGTSLIHLYLWTPHTGTNTGTMLANTTDTFNFFGVPFVGDINGDKRPEIVTLGSNGVVNVIQTGFKAHKYNENTKTFDLLWNMTHTDQSGATGMTLFDFNNDSISEIVYRDENYLRIINASGKSHITGIDTIQPYVIDSFISYSETFYEYPIVADIYGNQSSAILVTSDLRGPRPSGFAGNARIDIYTSDPSVPWAPARKVWNQYAYNAANINEDLTIPRNPLNIATVFAGKDSILGTSDDVRPYNNFLQQQTLINKYGNPIFLAPDAIPDQSISSTSLSGKSVSITIGIINQGDAAIGTPVYVTLYKESISAANILATGSYNGYINPGETGYVTVTIPDITIHQPFIKIIARINDDGTTFPYQPECDMADSELEFINPGLSLAMKKDATLLLSPPVADNGTYANPVSVLHNENIKYDITAVNANYNTGTTIIIKDTLPAFLRYVLNSASHSSNLSTTTTNEAPSQDILTWTITGLASMATQTVSYEASPEEGACASQPMFINRAWITASDTLHIVTGNNTYHQGAGVGVVTFSAGLGGNIYNSTPQVIDYHSTAQEGILVAPEEGYTFTGWSHEDYVSLRGQIIPAEDGIMHYDTLMIFGNVMLTANFQPEEYPIRYQMNEGENPDNNPSSYTIESGTITLEAPEKAGDTFIGWTGANGDKPQMTVTIPNGSTGERTFFANFLHSGKEDELVKDDSYEDKIWASKDELFVQTSKTGSVVRVYSTEGILYKLHTIISTGETRIKLRRGIYIVTLNNSIGQKVFIE